MAMATKLATSNATTKMWLQTTDVPLHVLLSADTSAIEELRHLATPAQHSVATVSKQVARRATTVILTTMTGAAPTAPLSRTDTHAQNLVIVTYPRVARRAAMV